MSGKRLAKSAVDWAKFGGLVPTEEQALFQTLKGKQDTYVTRVMSLPDALPPIDFSKYKSAVPVFASTIDSFSKAYGGVSVPYPKDGGKLAEIDAASKEQVAGNEAWVKESAARIAQYQAELSKWTVVPPLEHMEDEEWNYYFPGTYKDSKVEGYYLEDRDQSQVDHRLFEYQRDYDFRLAPWQGH